MFVFVCTCPDEEDKLRDETQQQEVKRFHIVEALLWLRASRDTFVLDVSVCEGLMLLWIKVLAVTSLLLQARRLNDAF